MRISDWSSDMCSSDLEGEGLRDDKGEILAEQCIPLSRARQRGLFPDAEDPLPAARVMSADLDRLASENHTLTVKRRSQMTADERNPGSRPHHHLLEHLKRGGDDQAIMLVEGEARRAAAAEQLLRSDARRVGKECVSTCISMGSPSQ